MRHGEKGDLERRKIWGEGRHGEKGYMEGIGKQVKEDMKIWETCRDVRHMEKETCGAGTLGKYGIH